MSNFWLGKWSHPQIKPELAFAGFYLASLECYWKSMFQTKAYIGFLGQTFPGLAPQGLVWFECRKDVGVCFAVWMRRVDCLMWSGGPDFERARTRICPGPFKIWVIDNPRMVFF